MVAEVLMLRSILGFKKRCMYVLPFVSIVTEKEQYLTKICENVNVKIISLHSQSENMWTQNTDLAICTIEKANSLINKIIEEKIYLDIEFFIIDEFHLLLDQGRGFLLESLISKLRTIERIKQSENQTQKSIQIIGMSATMSGLDKLQQWLDTEIYDCKFRPVPLSEYILTNHKLMDAKMVPILDL